MKKRCSPRQFLALFIACASFALFVVHRGPTVRPPPLDEIFYVWQRTWNDPLARAIHRADSDATSDDGVAGLIVLLAEVRNTEKGLLYDAPRQDWRMLSGVRSPITLAVRMDVSVADRLHRDDGGQVVSFLADLFARARADAGRWGVAIAGIHIDYDCPTSRLGDYASLLERLRRPSIAGEWSITTLPTWLASGQFARLVRNLDYYVLQVHSLECPTIIDRPLTICRPEDARRYVTAAARVGVPFFVSLPTYGYLVLYDREGRFAGLRAEGEVPVWRSGYQAKVILSDSRAMADLVAGWRRDRPTLCRGVAWFRLPVETDELNWSWEELSAVRRGATPVVSFNVETRRVGRGLYEVWIANNGERNLPGRVELSIDWREGDLRAYDLLEHFTLSGEPRPSRMTISGPPPAVGAPRMVGWFRLSPEENAVLRGERVEYVP